MCVEKHAPTCSQALLPAVKEDTRQVKRSLDVGCRVRTKEGRAYGNLSTHGVSAGGVARGNIP